MAGLRCESETKDYGTMVGLLHAEKWATELQRPMPESLVTTSHSECVKWVTPCNPPHFVIHSGIVTWRSGLGTIVFVRDQPGSSPASNRARRSSKPSASHD